MARFIPAIATGPTSAFALNDNANPFAIGLAVLLNPGSTGGAWQVEYTHSDLSQPPANWIWFLHPFMSAAAGVGSLDGNIAFPCAAVRLNVVSLPTGGTVPGYTFVVRQAGQAG